ncbi:hypothetical protein [Labrenzia sp. 011]|uniref:hypothetical protein n=1 Tax=Labrenzia sp. 011 TaxID=2171494 RepID=UPI000D520187|nr:hypothetical protein [Labrenzia sp. 011]PVB60835.1 hypothetical protein DCO57_15615 [Labrenzia sp. 011]
MEFSFEITENDIARVKSFVRQHENGRFVVERRSRNLTESKLEITKEKFWKAMTGARLTSVQRSGPQSPVIRFLSSQPFPLAYCRVCEFEKPEHFIRSTLVNAGGIRFSNRIAEDLSANLEQLQSGAWKQTLADCNALRSATSPQDERRAADHIRITFKGFGPKQSRNLLQSLGLTRYEIPIDSRVIHWLKDFGFPVPLSAAALTDSDYYNFISDGVQELCRRSGVEPCIFDAVIFSARDGEDWERPNILF